MPRTTLSTGPSAPWGWALAGAAFGLLLTVLLALPASWLAARVSAATGGQLVLADARGTVWNGSAQLVLTGGAGSRDAATLPTRLAWQLRPALLGANVTLTTDCCMPQPVRLAVRTGWRSGSLQVQDSQTNWPAGLLAGLGTPWNTLQLEGQLQLATSGLRLDWAADRMTVAGTARLDAQRLASRLSTLRPIGSYRLDLTGSPLPAVQLSTLDGALQLSGSGQWVGSRLRFAGQASAAPDREAALANLLNIIGRREGARSLITIG